MSYNINAIVLDTVILSTNDVSELSVTTCMQGIQLYSLIGGGDGSPLISILAGTLFLFTIHKF